MAIIKYDESETPLNNKQDGFTFQRNAHGFSMFPASRSARFRHPRQSNRQVNNQKAIRQWRDMSVQTKMNWNAFAAAFPQPSKKNPDVFLTGYQLFLKRNHFCFLNHGLRSDFMEEPELLVSGTEEITFEIKSGPAVIDCTELYLSNFGILPEVGDWLLLYAAIYGEFNGNFYRSVRVSIQVEEIFIDGMFINVIVPDSFGQVAISVYLSKPKKVSQTYVGTKTRYMGCFTVKKFTELQDVPEITPADADKVWKVNPAGTGMEFGEAGGGGLDCETVMDCDGIMDIEARLQAVSEIVSVSEDTSIPPVKYGLIYNAFVAKNPLAVAAGWRLPTFAESLAWRTLLGGSALAGGKLKEVGTEFWRSPNVGATDSISYHAHGSSYRSGTNGVFLSFESTTSIWTSTVSGTIRQYYGMGCRSNDMVYLTSVDNNEGGRSMRACRDAVGIPDGTVGTYCGNDGKIYRTIVYSGLEICADNLAETKYSDGTYIPEVTDNAEWAALTTGALAAPNNDWSNV